MSNIVYNWVATFAPLNEQAIGIPAMPQPPMINFALDSDGGFATHPPKSGNIKAVKLTEDNLRAVGAYIFRTTGDAVEIDTDGALRVGDPASQFHRSCYRPGQWLVEYYSYGNNEVRFRAADWHDREKYDLR